MVKRKILIADDEPAIRKLLTSLLEREECELLEAADGAEALAIARREHPDLMLMDVMLPIHSGLDVCLQLKADSSTWDIEVVIMSGMDYAEQRRRALNLGAAAFLGKPFAIRAIITLADMLLERQALGRESGGHRDVQQLKVVRHLVSL